MAAGGPRRRRRPTAEKHHVSAGNTTATGELLVTRHGLEGGAIYQLGPVLRAMPRPAIAIDFKPTFSHARLVAKMESVRRDFLDEARVRWRLGEAAHAILARTSGTTPSRSPAR